MVTTLNNIWKNIERVTFFFLLMPSIVGAQVPKIDLNYFLSLQCEYTTSIDTSFEIGSTSIWSINYRGSNGTIVKQIRFKKGKPTNLGFICGGNSFDISWNENGRVESLSYLDQDSLYKHYYFYENGLPSCFRIQDTNLKFKKEYLFCEDGRLGFYTDFRSIKENFIFYFCGEDIYWAGRLDSGYKYKGIWYKLDNKFKVLEEGEFRNKDDQEYSHAKHKVGRWNYYDNNGKLIKFEIYTNDGEFQGVKKIKGLRRFFGKKAPKINQWDYSIPSLPL